MVTASTSLSASGARSPAVPVRFFIGRQVAEVVCWKATLNPIFFLSDWVRRVHFTTTPSRSVSSSTKTLHTIHVVSRSNNKSYTWQAYSGIVVWPLLTLRVQEYKRLETVKGFVSTCMELLLDLVSLCPCEFIDCIGWGFADCVSKPVQRKT